MRVSSLLPLSHCEERERDEAILPRSKTRSPRFARDDGDNKKKARTFPSGPRLAALLFCYYLIFVFDFGGTNLVVGTFRSTCFNNVVRLCVQEERVCTNACAT